MGNWNITIRGVGCHHNKNLKTDANRMAAEFVKALKDAGHVVHDASITYGAEEQIALSWGYRSGGLTESTPDDYLAMRDRFEKPEGVT